RPFPAEEQIRSAHAAYGPDCGRRSGSRRGRHRDREARFILGRRSEEITVDDARTVRLQKIISQAGIASRRAAEKLIAEGRVSINGETVREMGTKADPSKDDIRVDGRRVKSAERVRYILLYKPAG